jgi:carbon monoxide dehydrogenase subunit G
LVISRRFAVDFSRTVDISAPIDEVWALTSDIEAVAECIPGVQDVEMTGPDEFTCKLVQRVGSVKAAFALRTRLQVDKAARTVVTTSEGQDRGLASTVKAVQTFTISAEGGKTQVHIRADVQITGRIATFGHRIIGAKAEQVTVEAIRNVEDLLAARHGG